jgi:uncharacterized NAD-dependent epimerase/dehydratase family protein
VLQHAFGRHHFEGLEELGCAIAPVGEEVELIRHYGARVLAMALNGEGLSPERLRAERERLERELAVPVALPLEEGVDRIVPAVRDFLRQEAGR